ncbi:MAG: sigma-70 family RNA polymerase sigma factor [Pseudomonadota bacterium]
MNVEPARHLNDYCAMKRGLDFHVPAAPNVVWERQRTMAEKNGVSGDRTPAARKSVPNAQVMANYLSMVARKRDAAAFEELFRYFAPRVKAYMLKLGADDALAEELTQEAMVSVWRKADRFDPSKAAPSTWIFTIARNLRIDAYRRSSRPDPDPNDPVFQPDAEPQADDAISQLEIAERLRGIIETLPEEQRAMLQLSYYQDKSHSEIAADAGIPLGTVKSRLRLAMQKVRHALGDEDK